MERRWSQDRRAIALVLYGVAVVALTAVRLRQQAVQGRRVLKMEERDAAGEAVGYDGLPRRLQQWSNADRSAPESAAALIEALFGEESASGTAPDDPLTTDGRTLVLIEA
jgi:hypothetical protein